MGHLLQGTSPGTTWMTKVRLLVEDSFEGIEFRNVTEMGFPEAWRAEPLWGHPLPLGKRSR